MKLNKLQLDKMIHNTLSYDYDEDGGLHFRRFTEAQLDAYRVYGVRNEVRAKASAGVTFDFITDSEFLVLKMDLYKGSSQQWADFDLYVDGIYTKQQRFDDYTKKLLNFSLPEGEHRVTLYFPWSAETVVQEVYLSDNATVKEVSKRAKAMVVGDSITQGYISEHTSLTYANQVARDTDIELVNQGIGGFHFGVETLDEALASFKPDLFLIAYGTNDYTRYETQEEFQKNVSAYMKKLTSLFPETKMLAILPIYRNDYSKQTRELYRSYTLRDARRILSEIYAGYDNIHMLTETGIPHIPEVFAEDYLHPNQLGFTFMAKAISKKVDELL